MDTDQEMIDWNTRWTLIGGLVICPSCLRGQPLSEAETAFKHEQDCKAGTHGGQRAWAALHNLLDAQRG